MDPSPIIIMGSISGLAGCWGKGPLGIGHVAAASITLHHHHHDHHHHGVHFRLGWLLGEGSIGHWSPIHIRIWSSTKVILSPIIWSSTRVIGIISPIVVRPPTSVTTRIRSRSTCTSTRGRPSASIRTTWKRDCCSRREQGEENSQL